MSAVAGRGRGGGAVAAGRGRGGGGAAAPAADKACHQCGKTGHLKRNCPELGDEEKAV